MINLRRWFHFLPVASKYLERSPHPHYLVKLDGQPAAEATWEEGAFVSKMFHLRSQKCNIIAKTK